MSAQNLRDASLGGANLRDTNLAASIVAGGDFRDTIGFTREQLYSTASYQERDLKKINLSDNDLTGWNFEGQDLTGAVLDSSDLTDTNLKSANLKNAYLLFTSNLKEAIFDSKTIYNQWTIFPNDFDPADAGLTLTVSPLGDVDADDALGLSDVLLLANRIRRGGTFIPRFDSMFDVDFNRKLNHSDLLVWAKDLKQTWLGDANLDGEFNSSDLVQVFAAGWYEKGRIEGALGEIYDGATWPEGDWNGDARFGTSDLVAAFEDGGYALGPRVAAKPVPEPTSLVLLVTALAGIAIRRRCVVS